MEGFCCYLLVVLQSVWRSGAEAWLSLAALLEGEGSVGVSRNGKGHSLCCPRKGKYMDVGILELFCLELWCSVWSWIIHELLWSLFLQTFVRAQLLCPIYLQTTTVSYSVDSPVSYKMQVGRMVAPRVFCCEIHHNACNEASQPVNCAKTLPAAGLALG